MLLELNALGVVIVYNILDTFMCKKYNFLLSANMGLWVLSLLYDHNPVALSKLLTKSVFINASSSLFMYLSMFPS